MERWNAKKQKFLVVKMQINYNQSSVPKVYQTNPHKIGGYNRNGQTS